MRVRKNMPLAYKQNLKSINYINKRARMLYREIAGSYMAVGTKSTKIKITEMRNCYAV